MNGSLQHCGEAPCLFGLVRIETTETFTIRLGTMKNRVTLGTPAKRSAFEMSSGASA